LYLQADNSRRSILKYASTAAVTSEYDQLLGIVLLKFEIDIKEAILSDLELSDLYSQSVVIKFS
jgi:hypothetical protein